MFDGLIVARRVTEVRVSDRGTDSRKTASDSFSNLPKLAFHFGGVLKPLLSAYRTGMAQEGGKVPIHVVTH